MLILKPCWDRRNKIFLSLLTIYLLIALSGFATLSWEVIWQIKSTLALGASAWGTAITLAIVMCGMSIGGFLMGYVLYNHSSVQAIRIYGLLEFIVGLAGLSLGAAFQMLEKLDTWAYAGISGGTLLIYIFGIIIVFGAPAICIGAALPVFGLIAEQFQISISKLYSFHTFGAAIGVLSTALILIPLVGMTHSIWIIAAINITVGFCAWLLFKNVQTHNNNCFSRFPRTLRSLAMTNDATKPMFVVFVTGFATFTLEVAWFRSLATTFPNTTDVFAILLASILIAISFSARSVMKLKQEKKSLGVQISLAGILILLVTPLIERFDLFFNYSKLDFAITNPFAGMDLSFLLHPDTLLINQIAIFLYVVQILMIFLITCFLIGLPIWFLSTAFPWILDDQRAFHIVGKFYAVNTIAGMVGAIGAAWFLLPTIGFAKTAWIAGALVILTGISITPSQKRLLWIVLCITALFIAIFFEAGIGKTRVQGYFANPKGKPVKILYFSEGPDATLSVIEYNDGARALLINSSSAAGESGRVYRPITHYMAWMGHLPMLLQPDPKHALVICFGTGQTANAVRKENPQSLDIVDINPNVFKMAHFFRSNEDVLHDPRVKAIVMDGRAYMRRTKKVYDIITLEPMPPIAAGVNALYSKEFYKLIWKRLGRKGVVAKWLPFQAVAPHYAASIAKTFISVFPNAILWIDPDSKNGIILGIKDNSVTLGTAWPGFARTHITRNLSQTEVLRNVALRPKELKRYGTYGEMISDDNLLLSYGKALYANAGLLNENFKLLQRVNS